jgi:hypothetical protein
VAGERVGGPGVVAGAGPGDEQRLRLALVAGGVR